MAKITAALVSELRQKSGAGMMDCKKALDENDGDLEAAQDWLRKKGLSAAAKKSGRVAAEGLVSVSVDGNVGAILEVNSETDFVARNEKFQAFVKTLSGLLLKDKGDLASLAVTAYPGESRTVQEQLTHLVATIGENMGLRRSAILSVEQGTVASYTHNAVAEGMGKIGVLVALQSEADASVLDNLGKQIAMHVAATNPQSLKIEDLDPALVERERDVLKSQAEASGKTPEIIEKMMIGRMRKFYEEVVLLEQISVIDGETKVGKLIEQTAREAGKPIEMTGFMRFALGEGIEKKEEDFAAEVAAAAGK